MLQHPSDADTLNSFIFKPDIYFPFPSKVSPAGQTQAAEMGGQHEAGGVDPESTSVPVQ